jgi:homoserine dehydrogenase
MRARKREFMPSPVDVPIALLGYGTVGSAVDRHLQANADAIESATGARLRVVHALVRDVSKRRTHTIAPGLLTSDFERIEGDDTVVAVAELMGGVAPASVYIERLLERGKGIATANKQLLAQDSGGLIDRVSAEGSVCGAIPVLRILRNALPPGGCSRVTGIVNGTTNFLLCRVELGATWGEALREAQLLGYAEQDPTSDLSGVDAAAKMAIIATVAFGQTVTIDDVSFQGIENVDAGEVRAAHQRGEAIRLIGTATPERVEVRVATLDATHPFLQARDADNAVRIEGTGFRALTLIGPGAGGAETASAVVADLVELVRAAHRSLDRSSASTLKARASTSPASPTGREP